MEQGAASTPGTDTAPWEIDAKEDRVELSVFIEIIWKQKNPSEMALPWGTWDLVSLHAQDGCVTRGPDAECPVCLGNSFVQEREGTHQPVPPAGHRPQGQRFQPRGVEASLAKASQGHSHLFKGTSSASDLTLLACSSPSCLSLPADSQTSPYCKQA